MKGRGPCIWVIYSMQFFTIRSILASKKHFGCYRDAEGAALKIKMLICGKDIGGLKCQGLIAFTAVATQVC